MTRETTEERSAAAKAAMEERRAEKVKKGELAIVRLKHDVVTARQHFHAGQEIFCPPETTAETVKSGIMSARELCDLHGAEIVNGKLPPKRKEVAIKADPIKAETLEDKKV